MILKRKRQTLCSLVLAMILFLLPLGAPAAAAAYPEGVTAQMASEGVPRTDTLLKNAAVSLTGQSLSGAIYSLLFSDETLSGILTGLYTNIEGQGGVLSALNLDTSPAAVAAGLTHYPAVQRRLTAAADWQSVDLAGASWNVGSKSGLAAAVSAMAAQNIGAGKWDRVSAITRIGTIYAVLMTGALVVLLLVAKRVTLLAKRMELTAEGGSRG